MTNSDHRVEVISNILLKYNVIEDMFGGVQNFVFSTHNSAKSLVGCRAQFGESAILCLGSSSITTVYSLKKKVASHDLTSIKLVLDFLDMHKVYNYLESKRLIEKERCEIEKLMVIGSILNTLKPVQISVYEGKVYFYDKFIVEKSQYENLKILYDKILIDDKEYELYKKGVQVCEESDKIKDGLGVTYACRVYQTDCEAAAKKHVEEIRPILQEQYKNEMFASNERVIFWRTQCKDCETGVIHDDISVPYVTNILNRFVIDEWINNLNVSFNKNTEHNCFRIMNDYLGVFAPNNKDECLRWVEKNRIEALTDVCNDQKELVGEYTNPLCIEINTENE